MNANLTAATAAFTEADVGAKLYLRFVPRGTPFHVIQKVESNTVLVFREPNWRELAKYYFNEWLASTDYIDPRLSRLFRGQNLN